MARTLVILVLTVFAFVHGWVACRLHSPPCRVYRSAARMPAPRASSRVCVSVLALAAACSARAEEMQSTHDVLFGCVVYPWLAWLVRWLLVLTSSQCLSPLLRFDYSFLNSSLQQLVQ